jgi:hypothetical protein
MKKTMGIIAAILLFMALASCSGEFIDPGVMEAAMSGSGGWDDKDHDYDDHHYDYDDDYYGGGGYYGWSVEKPES